MCLSFWDFGRKVFGLSLNGSRQFSKLQFMCPQISFVGKKFSSVPDFEPKISTSFPWKCEKDFKTASCVSTWIFWEKLVNVLENKKLYLIFFRFLFLNLSENLLKLQSKCPEDFFWGKRLLETPQNCLSFLRPEANHFWIFDKPFSIKLSKLHFMCPNKRFVEKS